MRHFSVMKSILINLLAVALVVASVNAEEKKPMNSTNEVAVIKTSEEIGRAHV